MGSVRNDHLAFIHVPKTGGTWVERALREVVFDLERPEDNGRRGHVTYDEMRADFRFGFVRDPATWYASKFIHRKTHEDWDGDVLDSVIRRSESFPHFVRTVAREHPGYLSDLYEQFLGPEGEVDFIGRYESLYDDLLSALMQSGVACELELSDYRAIRAVRPVNTRNFNVAMTPELREAIYASESRAVERFGY